MEPLLLGPLGDDGRPLGAEQLLVGGRRADGVGHAPRVATSGHFPPRRRLDDRRRYIDGRGAVQPAWRWRTNRPLRTPTRSRTLPPARRPERARHLRLKPRLLTPRRRRPAPRRRTARRARDT